jgi:hypothetical protein
MVGRRISRCRLVTASRGTYPRAIRTHKNAAQLTIWDVCTGCARCLKSRRSRGAERERRRSQYIDDGARVILGGVQQVREDYGKRPACGSRTGHAPRDDPALVTLRVTIPHWSRSA